jgi:ferredoxin
VRRVAVLDLPYCDEEDDVAPLLVTALADSDAGVRLEAAKALEGFEEPEVCIDCGVCIPECPVEAIVEQADLKPAQAEYLALNAKLAAEWPVITQSQDPLPDADAWARQEHKRALLSETLPTPVGVSR